MLPERNDMVAIHTSRMRLQRLVAYLSTATLAIGAWLGTAVLAGEPVAASPGPCLPDGAWMNVPWAVGGPRIEPDGSLRAFPGDWPDLPVTGLRLWDTRTAWLNLEPADDDWRMAHLDALVAKAEARGVSHLTLVLAGTPRWAAARVSPGEAPWLGPGSASPPRDLGQWRQFVRTVASRYAGRIDAYQVWNEPTDRTFFTGTPTQWAELVAAAALEVRAADPAARLIASGIPMNTVADLDRSKPWLAALAASDARVDALAVHWYPRTWRQLRGLAQLAGRFRARSRALGLPGALWVTEANARVSRRFTQEIQSLVISTLIDQAQRARTESLIWYAWLDLPTRLMPIHRGTPAARAIAKAANCDP